MKLAQECDMISQIKDALQDAASRKQNLLYKQRNTLGQSLNEQIAMRKA